MNNLKKIKLVHETPNHFIMHDGNTHFHVAKKGLDQDMMQKIQGFSAGGSVKDDEQLTDRQTKMFNMEQDMSNSPGTPDEESDLGISAHPASKEEYDKEQKLNQIPRNYYNGTNDAVPQPSPKPSPTPSPKKPNLEKTAVDFFNRMNQQDKESYADGGKVPTTSPVDSDFARKLKQGMAGTFAHGGTVDHNIDPKEMEEETSHLNTPAEYPKEWHNKLGSMDNFQNKPVQRFDVGGTAQGLPPDFDNRVEQEKQNLAVNATAMPPENIDNNNILPITAKPLDVNAQQSQAETNVAAQDQDQMSRAMQSEDAQKALTAQAVQDQNAKIQADNQVRMQAGLAPIPLTPAPSTDTIQQPTMVPKENQVSFNSQPSSAAPQNSSDPRIGQNLTGNFDKALKQVQGGINQNAKLQAEGMAENAKNIQANIEDQKQRAAQYEQERSKIQSENTELYNQVRDSKIDPNRVWNNASTGGKIAASLGLIFGGIGAGMTHQPNLAAEFLEKTIANDIDAQKADQSNKTNLYKLGLEKYKDSQSAQQFATLQASNILAGQIQATAQRIGSPQALALAQQAIGELHMKYDPIRNDLALKQVALNYGQQGQSGQQSGVSSSGVNTGKLNAFMNAGLYDEDTKKALMKEQSEYIKAKNYTNLADNLFDTQAKNANYTNRGILQHLPSMRASTKEYDAQVNSFLDKITKDLTGRVTPQSMENLRSAMPVAGDPPEVTLSKRNAIKDIIKTGYEFPTLINKGLLNPNDPVIQSTGNIASKFQQGAPVLKK